MSRFFPAHCNDMLSPTNAAIPPPPYNHLSNVTIIAVLRHQDGLDGLPCDHKTGSCCF